jgi:hypothetical protein
MKLQVFWHLKCGKYKHSGLWKGRWCVSSRGPFFCKTMRKGFLNHTLSPLSAVVLHVLRCVSCHLLQLYSFLLPNSFYFL